MRTTWAASAAISLCLVAAGLPAAAESPPAAGTFRPTGPPAELRATHAATLLTDGRVLVTDHDRRGEERGRGRR